MKRLYSEASKVSSLPLVRKISPSTDRIFTEEEKAGFLASQRIALNAAKEVSQLAQEGWTEKQAAILFDTVLKDYGVKAYFHFPFVWFGDRTRFDGVKKYANFAPSNRVLQPGEIVIYDVAPIYKGYVSDIGYTTSFGENPELEKARAFLKDLRKKIVELFLASHKGGEVWATIDALIRQAGYDNIHSKYPFSVLGHRVHRDLSESMAGIKLWNFGWQSAWSLASRGLFGQLLSEGHKGSMIGLWAVEPHIGGKDFGAKFEEILVIEPDRVYWLESEVVW